MLWPYWQCVELIGVKYLQENTTPIAITAARTCSSTFRQHVHLARPDARSEVGHHLHHSIRYSTPEAARCAPAVGSVGQPAAHWSCQVAYPLGWSSSSSRQGINGWGGVVFKSKCLPQRPDGGLIHDKFAAPSRDGSVPN